jgi:hypothetical protein
MTEEKNNAFEMFKEPFHPDEIEWRIGAQGQTQNGRIWALALAYVTNRAIMDRLDNVVGPANWQNRHRLVSTPDGTAYICEIGIKIADEWIWKSDGANPTQVEKIKGGLSDSMKRCAVQWGIGRYLYHLSDNYAQVFGPDDPAGEYRATYHNKKSNQWIKYKWNPPQLPSWALPRKKEQA